MTAQADALMGIFGFKRVEGKAMDKVSETRRGLFELSMRARLKVEGYSGFSLDSIMEQDYSSRIAGAWEGFNAALDAVEIVLPYEEPGYMYYAPDVVLAIESTNLGLRIK